MTPFLKLMILQITGTPDFEEQFFGYNVWLISNSFLYFILMWKVMTFFFISRYGGDVNAKTIFITQGTSYNDTPLHLAARHNHKMCIKKLIQANANLWTKNCLGLTAERFVTDPRLRDWMESVQRRPLTLQLQCSAAIRKYLQPDKTKNAITLPLPPNLLRQVLFEQDIKKIV